MALRNLTTRGGTKLYRRRRPLPAFITLIVLVVGVGVVWITVISSSGQSSAVECNPRTTSNTSGAPPGVGAGQALNSDALDKTTPLPAADVQVRVLNGTQERGKAGIVATALQQLGFKQTAAPANDPLYPNQNLQCRGQIRFGPNGASAARTISLIDPCMQLFRDDRQDASVDLALGTRYTDLTPRPEAVRILNELANWSNRWTPEHGGQQAKPDDRPSISVDLVNAARDGQCG